MRPHLGPDRDATNEPTTALRVTAELARIRGVGPDELVSPIRDAYDALLPAVDGSAAPGATAGSDSATLAIGSIVLGVVAGLIVLAVVVYLLLLAP